MDIWSGTTKREMTNKLEKSTVHTAQTHTEEAEEARKVQSRDEHYRARDSKGEKRSERERERENKREQELALKRKVTI